MENFYICAFCDRKFIQKQDLYQHMVSLHKVIEPQDSSSSSEAGHAHPFSNKIIQKVEIIDLLSEEDSTENDQELEYVDEEGNPVSIGENNADLYEVANIEPDKLSNSTDEDVLELDVDSELDGFQETSDLLTESSNASSVSQPVSSAPQPRKIHINPHFRGIRVPPHTEPGHTINEPSPQPPRPSSLSEMSNFPQHPVISNASSVSQPVASAPQPRKIHINPHFRGIRVPRHTEQGHTINEPSPQPPMPSSSYEMSNFPQPPVLKSSNASSVSQRVSTAVQPRKILINPHFWAIRAPPHAEQGHTINEPSPQPPRSSSSYEMSNFPQHPVLSYYCSLDGHSKPITSCCGTENKEIVSCSLDDSVNIWKVPVHVSDAPFIHESSVTGLILSASSDFALSSDGHGNLIFWKIDVESPTSSLMYAGKKKYDQGFIKGLSWLKCNKFACAVSQLVESGERNFLDVIEFNDSLQKTALSLEVKKSYTFEREISCLDTCDQTDTIVVGTKSGQVTYITPEAEHHYKMCDDWILGLCFYSEYKTSDRFSVSSENRCVKMYSVQNLLSGKETINPKPLQTFEPPDSSDSSKFTSVMCGAKETVCCGDSDGVLRIYGPSSLKFTKKIHDDLISGMCIISSYLFTSSLDQTVKGWNLTSFKQVCQFYSTAPVSCLSSIKTDSKVSRQTSNILVFGTTSGNVHILQFHTG